MPEDKWAKSNMAGGAALLYCFSIEKSLIHSTNQQLQKTKISTLFGVVPGASDDLSKKRANDHAEKIYKATLNAFNVIFEPKKDEDTAIEDLVKLITEGSKTISDLSNLLDDTFKFTDEADRHI
jgi:hypothetical protein